MALSFLFGGDTGETAESLRRKRQMKEELLAEIMGSRPQNVGQAVGDIFATLGTKIGDARLARQEKAGVDEAGSLFSSVRDRILNGGGSGASPSIGSASAASPASAGPAPVDISGSKQEFVNALLPAAIEESKRTGIDPRIIVAQAAQETGWGKSAPGNNFFGIKSHGKGGGQSLNTHEYVNGKRVNVKDSFRTFGSPGESVRGYGDFVLENPRYKPLREAQGLDAQLAALQASGYATDPNYSRSVGAIARGIQLPQEVASADPAAAFGAILADESQYSPEDRERLAAMRGPAPSAIPYSGPGARIDTPTAVYDDKGFRMEPAGQQPPPPSLSDEVAAFEQTPEYRAQFPGMNAAQAAGPQSAHQGIPPQFHQGSQQLANAQGGIMPALMGGAPASPDQVAQAQAMGQQQPQAAKGGGIDPQLFDLLNHPFATPEMKATARMLIEQQMQQADPMRALQMEEQRLKIDALRNPKPERQSLMNAGDGQIYDPNSGQWIKAPNGGSKPPQVVELFDEATGQPYKATWNPETQEYERVGGVKARSGMQLTTNPDGTVTLTEGAIGGLPKLTEAEGRNSGFYGRGVESHKILNDLESEGTSLWNNTVGNVPIAGNYLRSEDAQRYDQAKRDYINAVLRRESGAVISPEEFKNAEQQYFPQPGDGPDVIEQKRRNRETTIQGLKISAGQGAAFAVPSEQQKQPANPDEPDFSTMSDEELERFINGQ